VVSGASQPSMVIRCRISPLASRHSASTSSAGRPGRSPESGTDPVIPLGHLVLLLIVICWKGNVEDSSRITIWV
jgi:hypothetical protein